MSLSFNVDLTTRCGNNIIWYVMTCQDIGDLLTFVGELNFSPLQLSGYLGLEFVS